MDDFIKKLGPLAGASRFRRISEKLYSDGDKIYSDAGLDFRATWFPVYYLLAGTEEKLTINQIADHIGFSHITVKNVLRELRKKKLVVIVPNPDDGRSKLTCLSDKGRVLLEELRPLWEKFSDALSSIFNDGHPELVQILDRIDSELERKPISERMRSDREQK